MISMGMVKFTDFTITISISRKCQDWQNVIKSPLQQSRWLLTIKFKTVMVLSKITLAMDLVGMTLTANSSNNNNGVVLNK